LSGLESLTSIGGDLFISHNGALTSLYGLASLTSIGDWLDISYNLDLTSLFGLDNIDAESISNLYIANNILLSTCDVQSICDYLTLPNGTIEIYNNAPGCNNSEEVEEHCLTSVVEHTGNETISLFPNPASNFITFVAPQSMEIEEIIFYNHLGQKALVSKLVNNTVDVSKLKPGMYMVVFVTNENRYRTKMIKHN
jgi:hypothetical protein